jgi:asparagine synthase (glutamine-hydrolysing)
MCGIAGVLFSDSSRVPDRHMLKKMGDAIAHRGPDGEGFLVEPGVGLVHRRLAIIDLAGGDQPIGNEDGSIQVVFNGEIYNYKGLRSDLEARGHRFRTHSDTEVLVHLYEEQRENLVDRLRGMFAFALWDRNARRLLLARDRLGIKPLYFFRDAGRLVFGSEVKAILAYPDLSWSIDEAGLENYLALGMASGGRSIFRNVQQLRPGHTLVVGPDRLDAPPRRYWRLEFRPDESKSPESWAEEIHAKLFETVRLHLIADVPVGSFLSGGLDSSAVVAAAARATSDPLQTFTMGFKEEQFSELPYARAIAKLFSTNHQEQIVTADAVQLVEELTYYFDEPFADPSAIPTYLVSRMARERVKVVLSGDGGDEAFGGYSRYAHDLQEARWRNRLPAWIRRWALRPLSAIWPKADWLPRPLRAKTRLTNLALDGDLAYANTMTVCRQPLRRKLIAPDLAARLNGHEPGRHLAESFACAPASDSLRGMITADVDWTLADDFLVKVDRASMAHGLEVRPPLLDHELLEMAARIPSCWKVHGGETKWIFKKTCVSFLPADIVYRKKHGFDLPVADWLRRPLKDMFMARVLSPQSRVSALINQKMATKLFRSHLSGIGNHGGVLWGLLILAGWAERYRVN